MTKESGTKEAVLLHHGVRFEPGFDNVKSFMKKGGFVLKCKKCEILSWLELELCKGSSQAS